MLQCITCPDTAELAAVVTHVSPEAAALAHALEGCCHPRAGRLLAQIDRDPTGEELARLRGEIRQLLSLSFGPEEATRRLPLEAHSALATLA